jgi:hypothetical protein
MELDLDDIKERVHKLIEEHLPAKEKEKSELGEVFTPVSMIDTLYKRFPKNIWKNPSATWLDPAAGIGNFPLVLYFWLMDGLREMIPDATKRAKHIVEKMIYIVEINGKNIATCKSIFRKICPGSSPNIFQGDFLSLDTGKLGWPSKYTCVIGNPPYNIGGTGLEGSKRTHIVFTERGLDLLEPQGYLSYICPPSYRETDTPMNDLFQEAKGHFVFIKIYGASETHKLFRIQGRVDGFIFQKGKSGKTVIDDEYGVVTKDALIRLDRHIPNFGFTIFEKLFDKADRLGHVEAFRNTEMSSVKASTFGCGGRNKILHLIIEGGKRVYRSTKAHSLTKQPKLLINGLGVPYVYYDAKGEYGPSQSPVIVLNPRKNVVNLLTSNFFTFVAWGLRLTGNNNLPYLFEAVPDVSGENNKYVSWDEIRRGFHLSADEVKFIQENFDVPQFKNVDLFEKCSRNKTMKKK